MTGVELALLVLGVLMIATGALTFARTKSALATSLVVAAWIGAAWYAGLIA